MKGILDNTHADGEIIQNGSPVLNKSRTPAALAALSFTLATLIFTLTFSSPPSLANAPQRQPPATVSISGRVVDDRNSPVRGARVEAQGRRPVLTDGKGEFTLSGLAPAERLVVNFSAEGFMETTRVYQASAGGARIGGNGTTIIVWPLAPAVTLDATRGGKVPFRNGGGVMLPARSLVDVRGRPVSGRVRVSLTYLDVADPKQLKAAPGDFTARMKDGTMSRLESFGIFEISASDLSGQRVDLMKGRTATLEFPVPRVRRGKAPRATGLFSFDKAGGVWVEEGRLSRDGDQAVYVAPLNQLNTTWNSDNTFETTCMTVQVINPFTNPPNKPEANAQVTVSGIYYSYTTTGTTDANGRLCVSVKRCEYVSVYAFGSQNNGLATPSQNVMSSCTAAGANDCGSTEACPLVTLTLGVAVGTH